MPEPFEFGEGVIMSTLSTVMECGSHVANAGHSDWRKENLLQTVLYEIVLHTVIHLSCLQLQSGALINQTSTLRAADNTSAQLSDALCVSLTKEKSSLPLQLLFLCGCSIRIPFQ